MTRLPLEQILVFFGKALSCPSTGRFIREAPQQLLPERISSGWRPRRFSGFRRQEQTHCGEGMVAPALALEPVATAGHQQGGLTAPVRVG